MTILSWNVNGLRSALSKGFTDTITLHRPDVLCLQETRTPGAPIHVELPGYRAYWSHARKKGYAGTAIFLREEPISISEGLGNATHDCEGRVLTCELADFYIISVYVPNSKRDLSRLRYRCDEWDKEFLRYLRRLIRHKPVIFCGDLNVAHREIDLANPKANARTHGFTPEERHGFDNLIAAGFIDTFRTHNNAEGQYTWWSRIGNCRARNIGWRIDYVMMSESLAPRLRRAFILPDVIGSDHCPIGIEIE